jgi:hypothetical protein
MCWSKAPRGENHEEEAMRFGRKLTKRLTVGSVMVGAMLAASVAFAAWTATGSGNGYAKAGTAQALSTADASASTAATLYPGATGDVTITISNPNSYPVEVTSVTGDGAITSDTGPACDASTGVTYTDQTGLSLDVPAGGSQTFTLTGAVSMSNASDDSCQGAVFTIPVALSGASDA